MTLRLPRVLAAITLLLALIVPATPSFATVSTEVYYVPTTAQGGALIRVEVMRNTDFGLLLPGLLDPRPDP